MKIFKKLVVLILLLCTYTTYAQSEDKKEGKDNSEKTKPKENSSEEIVTKTIRIKGANGEEKVIKQQQVITKKSEVKLSPDEEDDKTNRTAVYAPEKVSVKNSGATSSEKIYSSIPDGNGYILTLIDEKGEKTAKAKPLSNDYYLINNGVNDNCLGHFDDAKNLIIETYDSETDAILTVTYKLK